MLFISPQKLFSFSRYLSFCLEFLVMYRKGLIKKIKVYFKVYGVTGWLTNNCNTHLAQYFEMSHFVYHVCLQQFLVSRICNNDLLNFNRSIAESFTPLDSACLLLGKSMFFELPVLTSLVLYLIHLVSVEVSQLYFWHLI